MTEEPETVYTGYEFGKRHGSKDTPDKQKWIRREIMPVSPRTRRPCAAAPLESTAAAKVCQRRC